MYTIDFLRKELLKFLNRSDYKKSSINQFDKEFVKFKRYSQLFGKEVYEHDIGIAYSLDVYNMYTKKYSQSKCDLRGRFIRFIDFYDKNGYFSLKIKPAIARFDAVDIMLQKDYLFYKSKMEEKYSNYNTQHYYLYQVYKFLSYVSKNGIAEVKNITQNHIELYLKSLEKHQIRSALCGLRNYFHFLNKSDLLDAIMGLKGKKTTRIIPILNDNEIERLWTTLNSSNVSYKDKSIFLLGYTLGIRAIDVVNLKLNDIHWNDETIQFIQRKTGNPVCLPLLPVVGNALYNYITKERKKTSYFEIFIREQAPFKPLTDHAALYKIVKKICAKANVDLSDKFCGMHFLRHNTASFMLKKEVPLETIAAVLGHVSPETTMIYISTDSKRLRECTLSFDNLSED